MNRVTDVAIYIYVIIYFTEEQFILNRLADAAIDIYGMVSVLSRASRTLTNGQPSSKHESTICQVFCDEVLN